MQEEHLFDDQHYGKERHTRAVEQAVKTASLEQHSETHKKELMTALANHSYRRSTGQLRVLSRGNERHLISQEQHITNGKSLVGKDDSSNIQAR
jgi:hypothetical protein